MPQGAPVRRSGRENWILICDGERGRAEIGREQGAEPLWRVLSALVLAPLAVGAAYMGGWAVLIFWGIAAFGVFWEWITLFSALERRLVFGLGATAITLAGLMGWIGRIRLPFFIIILGSMAIGVLARTSQRSWIVAGVPYAGTLVVAPAALTREPLYAFPAMMFVMAIVWMTDIFAYAGGRSSAARACVRRSAPTRHGAVRSPER